MDDQRQDILAALVNANSEHVRQDNGQWIGRSLAQVPVILDAMNARRVLLVIDRRAARSAGVDDMIVDLADGRVAGVFDAFTPNPTSDQPLAAARAVCACAADAIIALGGGSCMDVAKVGGLAAGAIERAETLVQGGDSQGVVPIPVLAIPTTSGTGSEATHFSAVYVQGKKMSVAHSGMRPCGVVLDWTLHAAMPQQVAAVTGLDALCQAVESLWAASATQQSRLHATDALRLIMPSLESSMLSAAAAQRERMMLGAHLAGRAINISKTTAAHALSYELTTRYGVAHGHAVALTLGHVAAFNALDPAATDKVTEATALLGVEPALMPEFMRDLLMRLGLAPTLSAVGVGRDQLTSMAQAADAVRLSNNPRPLSDTDALSILKAAY